MERRDDTWKGMARVIRGRESWPIEEGVEWRQGVLGHEDRHTPGLDHLRRTRLHIGHTSPASRSHLALTLAESHLHLT